MARGFVTGALWGVVVAGGGLVVASQLAAPVAGPEQVPVEVATALPASDSAADQAAADKVAADQVAADKVAADKAAADKVAADKAAADKVAADKAAAGKAAADKVAADKVAADKAAADKAAADKAAVDKAAADEAAAERSKQEAALAADQAAAPPVAEVEAPQLPRQVEVVQPDQAAPGLAETAPSLTGLDQALTVPAADAAPALVEAAPLAPDAPKDALLVPGQPQGQAEPSRLPQIAPVADPEVAAVVPGPLPEPAPESAPAPSKLATLPAVKPLQDKLPTTVEGKAVPGVTTGKLPQVGADTAPKMTAEVARDAPPIVQFARDFTPEGKPLFVILLYDVGSAGMARADLAKLPFAVSFVVDPLATDAKAASEVFRAAGQEVLTLANGIPPGAQASDLETTFATLSSILPQSVAVMDQDVGGFQDQRPLATLVLPVIKGEGRGLVTYDRGLNAADQIARREGVPAAVVFRRLDAEGESKQTIRRYLDRAAFKAAQEGAVVVIGDTRADTVAAILEWTVEGRAATVSLAPVTAVMGR